MISRLERKRIRAGFSQKDVAERLGTVFQTVNQWEKSGKDNTSTRLYEFWLDSQKQLIYTPDELTPSQRETLENTLHQRFVLLDGDEFVGDSDIMIRLELGHLEKDVTNHTVMKRLSRRYTIVDTAE